MRARKVALWAGRLAVVAAVGIGAASAGPAAAAEWGTSGPTSEVVEAPDEDSPDQPTPDEAWWERGDQGSRSAPNGYSTMLEPWWE